MTIFLNLAIAFFLLWIQPASASELTDQQIGIQSSLAEAPIVYLGEIHDRPEDHDSELEILTNLSAQNPDITLGFEMFQRPFQPYLDRYIPGEMTEEDLHELSQYDTRWGFDWEFYAPLLRLAKEKQFPMLALNTPTEITEKVATQGLDNLESQDYRYIPAYEDLDFSNEIYLEQMKVNYQEHVENGYGNSVSLDNFVAAQILWDETMAEVIANHYADHPERQILVFVGQAHIANNFGIPDRIARRHPELKDQQKTVFLSSYDPVEDSTQVDFIWQIFDEEISD